MKRRQIGTILLAGTMALSSVLISGCGAAASESAGTATISYESVDDLVASADAAYESGDYDAAFENYAAALETNPVSIEAQIGLAKCQLQQKHYGMAYTNLQSAVNLEPEAAEIYDLLIQLSEESGDISYARSAVKLAERYNVEDILNRVPESPVFSYESGSYEQKLSLDVTAAEGSEIYMIETKDSRSYSYVYDGTPIPVTTGETTFEAYCVQDGVPSTGAEITLNLSYEPTEVTFADPLMEQLVRLTLDIPDGAITDIDCESVTYLDKYDLEDTVEDYDDYLAMQFSTLEDLQYFPNLTDLDLEDEEKLMDYAPIACCRKLEYLHLYDCNIADISFVSKMNNLYSLYLSGGNVSDLQPAADCISLRSVTLYGNPVNDLTPLMELDLVTLQIDYGQLSSLADLQNFPNLSSLTVYEVGGVDLGELAELTKLTSLSLYNYAHSKRSDEDEAVNDLSFLAALTNLESLRIYGLGDLNQLNYITDNLANLTTLRIRDAENDRLEDSYIEMLQSALPNCDIN